MSRKNTKWWRPVTALLLAVTLLAMLTALASAQPAQAVGKTDPRVLPPSSYPYGLSYSEWSIKWWHWATATPFSASPLNTTLDPAAGCGVGQSGSVWFLGGALGSPGDGITRDCVVPPGTALFVPIVNVEWDEEGMTIPVGVDQLRQIAASITDHTKQRSMTVDGVPIPDDQIYRTPSRVFWYTMPAVDNLYQLKCAGGFTPTCKDGGGNIVPFPLLVCTGGLNSKCTAVAVGDGYYVMLAPLPVGSHTIHFHGVFTHEFDMTMDVTYHITVGSD